MIFCLNYTNWKIALWNAFPAFAQFSLFCLALFAFHIKANIAAAAAFAVLYHDSSIETLLQKLSLSIMSYVKLKT